MIIHILIKHCIWPMLSIYLLWHWKVQLQMPLKFKRCHSDLQITLSAFEVWYEGKNPYFVWFGTIPRYVTYWGTFFSLAWQTCVSGNGHFRHTSPTKSSLFILSQYEPSEWKTSKKHHGKAFFCFFSAHLVTLHFPVLLTHRY